MMTNRTVDSRTGTAAALLAVCLAMLATLIMVSPARAASSVEIQARALMGGRYEVDGWAAIAVTLVNDGEPTEGSLTAETDGGTVQRFVEMPAGARKIVMLYVQPEAFQRRITVDYQEPNGTVSAEVEIRVLEQSGSQLAIVGDGGGTLRPQLADALDETASEPITIGPADVPERPEPLNGITAMIWAADSSSLSEAQRRSLERWVAGGGELIVVGGADWQARTAAFAAVLPMSSLAAIDGVPQAALAAWSGTADPAVGSDTVAAGDLQDDARALITAEDGTVLLSMRAVGGGRTMLVGPDLATDPYRAWEGSPRLWTRLVPTSANLEQFFGGGFPVEEETLTSMTQALSNLPSLEVPPAELLLGVIVAYILLIGPISYLVLRRLDRREMAWVTAPVLVVFFTASSFGIGNALKGSDVITNQISLIHTSTAGATASVETYAGVFSPQRSTYDLRVDAEALMAALRPQNFGGQPRAADVTVEQGNPAQVRDLAVGVFGFEGVRADAVVDYEPSLTVSWRREDGDLLGTVTNIGDTTIADVAYISTSAGERIGDLAPGQEAEFEVPTTNFNGSPASDQVYGFGGFDGADAEQREIGMRRQVIDSLVGYGSFMPGGVEIAGSGSRGPFIIGWRADEGPLPVLVDELSAQRYAQSVEVLRVRAPFGVGEVTIRPAQMSIAVTDTQGDVSSGGPGTMLVGEGSVTYSVTLPLEASEMEVSELDVLIGPDPSMVFSNQGPGGGFWPAGITAEIRDPESGEWRPLGDISDDSQFEIEDPSTVMSVGGRIEVRITGGEVDPNFGQASVFVSAEATGVIDQ